MVTDDTTRYKELLLILRDQERSLDERSAAFQEMLDATGPWSPTLTFLEFVHHVAQVTTRGRLHRIGLPADGVSEQDLAHDVLIVFFERAHTMVEEESVGPWIRGVARNIQRRYVRRHWSLLTADELMDDMAVSQEEEVPSTDLITLVEKYPAALATLSENLRRVVHLHLEERQPLSEVARMLHLTSPTVRQRWLRARRLLAAELR